MSLDQTIMVLAGFTQLMPQQTSWYKPAINATLHNAGYVDACFATAASCGIFRFCAELLDVVPIIV